MADSSSSSSSSSSSDDVVATLIAEGAERVADNVVAASAVTGNRHVLYGEGARLFRLGAERLAHVPNGGELRHERAGGVPTGEHDPVTLPPLAGDVYTLPNLKEFSAISRTTVDLED